MDIPSHLLTQISDGRAVLFLGAGASFDALNTSGKHPPSAQQLGEMLADQFLGGKYRDLPLNQISEYSVSESDLPSVQTFIKTVFEPFRPTPAHEILPTFNWAGLATTNYDLLVEDAYARSVNSLQILQPFIENGDRVDERMRDPKAVMYLKLHGCITRLQNPDCPLILTTEQYIEYRQGRSRLFEHLKDWGYERTFIFIGYSLQDTDVRAILNELNSLHESRPRYYLIAPGKGAIENRFWETRKVTSIEATFSEFMLALSKKLPIAQRGLLAHATNTGHIISKKFAISQASLSRNSIRFLESDVDYIKGITSTETVEPPQFYRGYSKGWAPIEQNLDIRRALGDTILSDHVLIEEPDHEGDFELFLIKSHAGGGKSILLHRIAWDAAHDYGYLCLFLKPGGVINTAALEEISEICKERIFLFVDDAGDRIRELQALKRAIATSNTKITVIAAERINEWNIIGGQASSLVTKEHELRYLSKSETIRLIECLSKHRSLGTLENKCLEEQQAAFLERAGRQLLVALHEATLGLPFEEIIENEYQNIVPDEARRIYLTICVLNRLNVPVRAGIISRLHGVLFTDFKDRLFLPLEHVVHALNDPATRDFVYVARHPLIAEIVFDRVLRNQEERFDIYIRVLRALNIDYSSDRKAFRAMTRGRAILELFPNDQLANQLFKAAFEISKGDPILFHQQGLYEMHRNNLRVASDLFSRAVQILPNNHSIQHSRAELYLRLAECARTDLERDRFLREATIIAKSVRNAKLPEAHSHHTLVKIGLARIRSLLLRNEEESHSEIADAVRNIERDLSEALLEFPNDSHLLSADSEFAKLLNDSSRVISSLRKAFDSNPRAGFLAVRLATQFESSGVPEDAKAILERALEANRSDRMLHFRYAKHLMSFSSPSPETITYHLHRSFTPGDSNYDAQLLYARQLFLNGDKDKSYLLFRNLKNARVGIEIRGELRYPLPGEFRGAVTQVEASYARVRRDGVGDIIPIQRRMMSDSDWKELYQGARVRFRIAFNFFGPSIASLSTEECAGRFAQ